jgi:hypothetical protein
MRDIRLFVIRLAEPEATQMGGSLEVQVLKADGRVKAVAYANPDSKSVVVGGCEVGSDVLEKGLSLPEGQGIYLDLAGNELSPF